MRIAFAQLLIQRRAIGLLLFAWFISPVFTSELHAQMPELDGRNNDIRHLGTSETLSLVDEPQLLWSFNAGSSLGSVKVAGDHVFVRVNSDIVVALQKSTGRALWKTQIASDQITGMAYAKGDDQDFLIVTTYEGATGVDAKTGRSLWRMSIDFGLAAPVYTDGAVIAAGYSGVAVRLNVENGEVEWEHDFLSDAPPDPDGFDGARARLGDRPARPQSCSSDGVTAYFNVFDQCRVVGVDVKTGERRASMLTEGWVSSRPVVSDNHVLLGSQDKHVYAMDQDMGHALWKFKTGSRVSASPAVDGDRVYAGSCDANFYCLNLRSGDELWRFEINHGDGLRGSIYEQAIVCKDNVILPAMNGDIYALDKMTGELKWQMRVDEHSEIIDCQTDGEAILIMTRKNSDELGTPALHMIGNR